MMIQNTIFVLFTDFLKEKNIIFFRVFIFYFNFLAIWKIMNE